MPQLLGAGEAVFIDFNGLAWDRSAMPIWFKDARRLILAASEKRGKARLLMADIDGVRPLPIAPHGASGPFVLSPDERLFAVAAAGDPIRIFPVGGGRPWDIPGGESRDLLPPGSSDICSIYMK